MFLNKEGDRVRLMSISISGGLPPSDIFPVSGMGSRGHNYVRSPSNDGRPDDQSMEQSYWIGPERNSWHSSPCWVIEKTTAGTRTSVR